MLTFITRVLKSHKLTRINKEWAFRLNDQLRANFRKALSKSSYKDTPSLNEARKEYIRLSRRYSYPDYKFFKWISASEFRKRIPFFIVLAAILSLGLGAATGTTFVSLAALGPFIIPFSIVWGIYSWKVNSVEKKLRKYEKEVSTRYGDLVHPPPLFKVNGTRLSLNGYQLVVNNDTLYKITQNGELEPFSEHDGLNITLGLPTATPIKKPAGFFGNSIIVSPFNTEKQSFERPQTIPFEAFELLTLSANNQGYDFSFSNYKKLKSDNNLLRLKAKLSLKLIFPKGDSENLYDEISKLTLEKPIKPFGAGKTTNPVVAFIKAIEGFHINMNIHLLSAFNKEEVVSYVISGVYLDENEVKALGHLIQCYQKINDGGIKLSFANYNEIIKNLGPYSIAVLNSYNSPIKPDVKDFVKGRTKWGAVAAYYLQYPKISSRLSFAEIKEAAESYHIWGEKALEILKNDHSGEILSFEQAKAKALASFSMVNNWKSKDTVRDTVAEEILNHSTNGQARPERNTPHTTKRDELPTAHPTDGAYAQAYPIPVVALQ